MEKKKKKLSKNVGRLFLTLVFLSLTAFFAINISKQLSTTFSLTADRNALNAELKQLEAEKEALVIQKEKLNDPNYIKSVARGKYLITKSSDQIFVLPTLDD